MLCMLHIYSSDKLNASQCWVETCGSSLIRYLPLPAPKLRHRFCWHYPKLINRWKKCRHPPGIPVKYGPTFHSVSPTIILGGAHHEKVWNLADRLLLTHRRPFTRLLPSLKVGNREFTLFQHNRSAVRNHGERIQTYMHIATMTTFPGPCRKVALLSDRGFVDQRKSKREIWPKCRRSIKHMIGY